MKAVQGLHHLTVMASDPQKNVDFYTQLLGQRMVKVTVNFDDPGTYHLYYGDEVGSPGTIMTFFPWVGSRRGKRGNGEVVAAAYRIHPGSLQFWQDRLITEDIPYAETTRFGSPTLVFEDPDGLLIELVAEEGADVPQFWNNSPIPAEEALHGFHSVTIWADQISSLRTLLTGHLGFTEVGQEQDPEGPRTRFKGDSDGVGLFIDVVERPGKPQGQFSAGSVHHVALRTRDDSEQEEYLAYLSQQGYNVTPVQDRQYFHSIYFRDQSGVLFEIATDAPGFPADEPVEELGKHLKLPHWYESKRSAIEARVKPIVNHEYGVTIGGTQQESTSQTPGKPSREVKAGPHQGETVLTAGRPLMQARVAMVLLHGRGGNARDILSLSQQFNQSAYAYLAPQAQGNTWYPMSFLAPTEQNEPHLTSALDQISLVFDHLEEAGIPRENVIIGGFSQGACLALEYVARNPGRYGGVFGFSGGLIGPQNQPISHTGNLQGTPIYLGCSDTDSHIPLSRVQETTKVLSEMGAHVSENIFPGMGHTINDQEIQSVIQMMQNLAAQTV